MNLNLNMQMKAVNLVKISAELLKVMSENGILIDDWKYVAAFDEYLIMRKKGEKYNYAISLLSLKYKISESTLKRVIRRFGKDVVS